MLDSRSDKDDRREDTAGPRDAISKLRGVDVVVAWS